MPRRGGSFVKHRHKYVAKYKWETEKDSDGKVVSAECTRTLACTCGKIYGEETVEASFAHREWDDDMVACTSYTDDLATAVFSDGDIKQTSFNHVGYHDDTCFEEQWKSNGDGTHSATVAQCVCSKTKDIEAAGLCEDDGRGVCRFCGGKMN